MERGDLHHIGHQEGGSHGHHDGQHKGGIADRIQVACGIAHLLLLIDDVLYRRIIPNRIDGGGVFWILQAHVERSRQCVGRGLFHHDGIGVLEKLPKPLIGFRAVAVFHGLDGIIRVELLFEVRTGGSCAIRVPGRNVLIELDHDLDAVEIDLLGVLGQVSHHDAGDNEPHRNGGGDDHGDGHGQVAAKTLGSLAENKP